MSLELTAETIVNISNQCIIYVSAFILLSGLVGHAMNILVFSSTTIFRRNQSAFYLITDSIVSCVLLLIPLLFRILTTGDIVPALQGSVFICKTRRLFGQGCVLLSLNIVCFAAFDQYLATNHRPFLRQLSTLKLAYRLVLSATVIWTLHGIPFSIYFTYIPYYQCYTYNVKFANYIIYIYYPVLMGLLPMIISTSFATLAYSNVRRIVRWQLPVARRKLDKQLTAMIFVRVAILVIVTLPHVIQRIYILTITANENDPIKLARNNLIDGIILSIYYLNYSCTFYMFLLSSARFRRQTKYALKKCWKKCCGIEILNNQISPMSQTPSVAALKDD